MTILTDSQVFALKKEAMNKGDMLITAALAAFFAASAEFNSALGIPTNTQNLGDITGAIGGENNEELNELLEGIDVLTSIGGDAISGICAAVVGTGLYTGFQYFGYGKYAPERELLSMTSKAVFGSILGKSVAYVGAKEITAQIAIHTITAVNPLLHIPMSITFAVFYGIFSTLFTEYAKYKVTKDLVAAPHQLESYTFRQHMNRHKDKLLKEFCCNFMTGLALYGSTLIPGLNTAESIATTVAITSATAGGTRAAWAIATANPQLSENRRGSINNENDTRSHVDDSDDHRNSGIIIST